MTDIIRTKLTTDTSSVVSVSMYSHCHMCYLIIRVLQKYYTPGNEKTTIRVPLPRVSVRRYSTCILRWLALGCAHD